MIIFNFPESDGNTSDNEKSLIKSSIFDLTTTIGLCKTWSTLNVNTFKLGFYNCVTYHCDCNSNTSNCSRRDDILLSVNIKYLSHALTAPANPVKHIFVIV